MKFGNHASKLKIFSGHFFAHWTVALRAQIVFFRNFFLHIWVFWRLSAQYGPRMFLFKLKNFFDLKFCSRTQKFTLTKKLPIIFNFEKWGCVEVNFFYSELKILFWEIRIFHKEAFETNKMTMISTTSLKMWNFVIFFVRDLRIWSNLVTFASLFWDYAYHHKLCERFLSCEAL